MKHTPLVILCLLCVMGLSVGWLFSLPQVDGATGLPHTTTEWRPMQTAPDGNLRHPPAMLWAGAAYGVCSILIAVMLAGMGVRTQTRVSNTAAEPQPLPSAKSTSDIKPPLVILAMIYAGVLLSIVYAYATTVGQPQQYVLGFPQSQAIMLYVFTATCPLLYAALYVFYFPRWVCHPDDLARFRKLVDQQPQHAQTPDSQRS